MKYLCIYHADCPDGFGSAFIVWKSFREKHPEYKIDFHAAQHGSPPPLDLAQDRTVYLVDYCYKKDPLIALADVASSVVILDHHVSVFHDLLGEEAELAKYYQPESQFDTRCYAINRRRDLTYYYSPKDCSGVGVTWNHFNRAEPIPFMFDCIQDRDLWRWKIPESKGFLACLDIHDRDFYIWDGLLGLLQADGLQAMMDAGAAVEKYDQKTMDILIHDVEYIDTKYGEIPIINCPRHFTSDIGNRLCQDYPFSLMYRRIKREWSISLRSREGGEDVSKICAGFGGGGHKAAGGFSFIERFDESLITSLKRILK